MESKWRPIETAPKDGTVVDLWINDRFTFRLPDCFWGKPAHCCGEAGVYCDSEWHSNPEGWVDSTFNEFVIGIPTHWMPLPLSPEKEQKEVAEW